MSACRLNDPFETLCFSCGYFSKFIALRFQCTLPVNLARLSGEHPITNKGVPDMKNLSLSLLMAASMSCSAFASAADVKAPKPTVVLVHGAFSDGSTWNKVIPLLEAKGLNVVAVQNPLTFAEDTATTRRALARVKGPVVLVGHSYGGVSRKLAQKMRTLRHWSMLQHLRRRLENL
jgi:pimeloyl-ACP methyl ester carboxylesterase